MTETVHIARQELTAPEIQDLVEDGVRVHIEVEALGTSMSLAVRECDGTYYCDTQTKLLTRETATAFRHFLRDQQLASRVEDSMVATQPPE